MDFARNHCREGRLDRVQGWWSGDDQISSNQMIELVEIAVANQHDQLAIWILEHRMARIKSNWFKKHPSDAAPTRIDLLSRKRLVKILAGREVPIRLAELVMTTLRKIPDQRALDQIGIDRVVRIPGWDVPTRLLLRADDRQLQAIAARKRAIEPNGSDLWIGIFQHSKGKLTESKVLELLHHFPITDDYQRLLMRTWYHTPRINPNYCRTFITATRMRMELQVTNLAYLITKSDRQYVSMMTWIMEHYPVDLDRDHLILLSQPAMWPLLQPYTLGNEAVLWYQPREGLGWDPDWTVGCVCGKDPALFTAPTSALFYRIHLQFDQDRELFVRARCHIMILIDLEYQGAASDPTFRYQLQAPLEDDPTWNECSLFAIREGPLLDGVKHALKPPKR